MHLPEMETQQRWAREVKQLLRDIRNSDPAEARVHSFKVVYAIADTIDVQAELPSSNFLKSNRKVACSSHVFDHARGWLDGHIRRRIQLGKMAALPDWEIFRQSTKGRHPALHGFVARERLNGHAYDAVGTSEGCAASNSEEAIAGDWAARCKTSEAPRFMRPQWPPLRDERAHSSPCEQPVGRHLDEMAGWDAGSPAGAGSCQPASHKDRTGKPAESVEASRRSDSLKERLLLGILDSVMFPKSDLFGRFLQALAACCVVGFWLFTSWRGSGATELAAVTGGWSPPLDPVWKLVEPYIQHLDIQMCRT